MPTMEWRRAEQKGDHFHFRVCLDTTKQLPDGRPDPMWERRYRFSATAPTGWTAGSLNGTAYTDWTSYVQAEVELLALADYNALLDPVTSKLSFDHTTFTPS